MSPEKLAYMANQIAAFFHAKPEPDATDGVARHITDFWEPRMRRQLFEIIGSGSAQLDPLVIAAAPKIRRPADVAT